MASLWVSTSPRRRWSRAPEGRREGRRRRRRQREHPARSSPRRHDPLSVSLSLSFARVSLSLLLQEFTAPLSEFYLGCGSRWRREGLTHIRGSFFCDDEDDKKPPRRTRFPSLWTQRAAFLRARLLLLTWSFDKCVSSRTDNRTTCY